MMESFSGWSRSLTRLVEHARALALGLLQQVGGVEVLAVGRRVLMRIGTASRP